MNVCQSSEVLFPAFLGGIIGFMLEHMLLVCTLAYIITNKNPEGPSRPAEGHETHCLPNNSLADLALEGQQNIRDSSYEFY
ncbi:MAG: hypothetical protein PG981_000515 [Wolbachia endosymbiont of Ctenocephalides orientis wCori]|nr:MAG: hypothetical protein PG981_000515 [Wolbachia endosymbiont of Ctenocephalides orientis wCori]